MKKKTVRFVVFAMIIAFCFSGSTVCMAEGGFWSSISNAVGEIAKDPAAVIGALGEKYDSVKEELLTPEQQQELDSAMSEAVSALTDVAIGMLTGDEAGGMLDGLFTGMDFEIPAADPENEKAKEYAGEVLIDTPACSMSVTGIDPFGEWGYTVFLHCENKTDSELNFSADFVSVNDRMTDPYWFKQVAPETAADSEMLFIVPDCGLIQEIRFSVSVAELEDDFGEFCIYPVGIPETEPVFEWPDLTDASILFEKDFLTAAVTECGSDGIFGYAVKITCENFSEQNLTLTLENTEINGIPVESFWNMALGHEKFGVSEAIFFEEDLTAAGITSVDSFDFDLVVSAGGSDGEPVLTEHVSFEPPEDFRSVSAA